MDIPPFFIDIIGQAPRLLRQRGAELRQSCEQCAGTPRFFRLWGDFTNIIYQIFTIRYQHHLPTSLGYVPDIYHQIIRIFTNIIYQIFTNEIFTHQIFFPMAVLPTSFTIRYLL